MPERQAAQLGGRSFAQAVGFLVSIPVFLLTRYAWLLWMIVPLGVGMIGRRLYDTRRRRALADQG